MLLQLVNAAGCMAPVPLSVDQVLNRGGFHHPCLPEELRLKGVGVNPLVACEGPHGAGRCHDGHVIEGRDGWRATRRGQTGDQYSTVTDRVVLLPDVQDAAECAGRSDVPWGDLSGLHQELHLVVHM